MRTLYRLTLAFGVVVLVFGASAAWLFIPPEVTVISSERFTSERIDNSTVIISSVESPTEDAENTYSYHLYNKKENYTYFISNSSGFGKRSGFTFRKYSEGGHANGTWVYERYTGNESTIDSLSSGDGVLNRVNGTYAVTFESSTRDSPREFQFGGLGRVGIELVGYERVGTVKRNGTTLTKYEPQNGWYRFERFGTTRRITDTEGKLLYNNRTGVVWNASVSYTLVRDVDTRFEAYTKEKKFFYSVQYKERRVVKDIDCPKFTTLTGPDPERCE